MPNVTGLDYALQPMKRPRLRFTLRTLAIVVTLVCCYAACWGPTKRNGVMDVYCADLGLDGSRSKPLRLLADLDTTVHAPFIVSVKSGTACHFYFWFFGFVAKLPYERELVDEQDASRDALDALVENYNELMGQGQ